MLHKIAMTCIDDNGHPYEDEPCQNEPTKKSLAFRRAINGAAEECKDYNYTNHDSNIRYYMMINEDTLEATVMRQVGDIKHIQTIYRVVPV